MVPKSGKMDQKGAKMEPRWAKMEPRWAKMEPRWCQDAEKRPSLAMRLRRYGNCTVVRTPRGTPRWAKTFSDRAGLLRVAPHCARVPLQIRPKSAPRCPF